MRTPPPLAQVSGRLAVSAMREVHSRAGAMKTVAEDRVRGVVIRKEGGLSTSTSMAVLVWTGLERSQDTVGV